MIRFQDFSFQHEQVRHQVIEGVQQVIDSGSFIYGSEVSQFEQSFSKYQQTQFSCGVANGLDAIRLALLSLGIGEGDEVIVPSNTYIATWLAVHQVGAMPIPVEPLISTSNLNPDLIHSKITKKTKAIIPVHLYGLSCEMKEILEIARSNSLYVIEDFAQAHGAVYNNQKVGSLGDINACSFYPTKNLGCMGDGGCVVTNKFELINWVRIYANYGSSIKNVHVFAGINSRLDNLQASILKVKLSNLDNWNSMRAQIASWYYEFLAGFSHVILPPYKSDGSHVYHLFVVYVNHRDELKRYLLENEIETAIHYPTPPHLQSAFSFLHYEKGAFPIAEWMSNTALSLPIYPGFTKEDCKYVCEKIRNFYL